MIIKLISPIRLQSNWNDEGVIECPLSMQEAIENRFKKDWLIKADKEELFRGLLAYADCKYLNFFNAARITTEVINGRVYAVCYVSSEINSSTCCSYTEELSWLKEFIEAQYSDGYGEDLNVCDEYGQSYQVILWEDSNWNMEVETYER